MNILRKEQRCDRREPYIIGYKTYIDLVKDFLTNQEIVSTSMVEEVEQRAMLQ
ncbi:hypothetical protein KHA80_21745 [Anaerobacillus sp. HL2]|nr:hypothetical protein KHA80_21745 [Anaerobacillus sp. HL2]